MRKKPSPSPLPRIPSTPNSQIKFKQFRGTGTRLYTSPREPTQINTNSPQIPSLKRHSFTRPSTAKVHQQVSTDVSPRRPSTTSAAIVKPVQIDQFLKTARRLEFTIRNDNSLKLFKKLSKTDGSEDVPLFISNFVRNRVANDCALIIQRCWRKFIEKAHWRGILNHRIWSRKDILIRLFTAWRGSASNNFNTIIYCFTKFEKLYQEKPWVSYREKPAPFGIFYLTHRWFLPSAYDAQTFYVATRLFAHRNGKWILQLWHRLAVSRRAMRAASISFRFTIKKRLNYGYSFFAFILWHRYTQWKKQDRNRKECFKLKCTEFVIDWRVREAILNYKKALVVRANKSSVVRVVRKAHNALYQLFMDRKQHAADMESSMSFYLHHVQERGERAWMRYIEIQRHKRAETTKLMRAWYSIAYMRARRRAYLEIMQDHQVAIYFSKIFRAWKVQTREGSLRHMKCSFKIQKKPILAYLAVFKMIKKYEFSFFIQVFREWLAFARRRSLWKRFSLESAKITPDLEFKQKIFFGLARAADMKIIRRFVHPSNRFFPHSMVYSYEGMLKMIKESAYQINNWKFVTTIPKSTNKLDNFTEDVLIRSLVLGLNTYNPYDAGPVHVSGKEDDDFANFEKVRTFEELKSQFTKNCSELRKQLIIKLQRDSANLSVITSHFSAVNYNEMNLLFSISTDLNDLCKMGALSNYVPTLNFYTEINESIDHHIKMLLKQQHHLPEKLKKDFQQAVAAFHARLRAPAKDAEISSPGLSPRTSSAPKQTAQTRISLKANTNNFVLQYNSPVIKGTIPFEDPFLEPLQVLQNKRPPQITSRLLTSRDEFNNRLSIDTMRLRLANSGAALDMCQALRRFFFCMTDLRIDVSHIIDYKSNSLECEEDQQHFRHLLRRNIAAFLAQICRMDISVAVPLVVNAPPYAFGCVSAVLTVFREIRKSKFLPYCAKIPFSERIDISSQEVQLLRSIIVSKTYEKFPKLAKDVKLSGRVNRRSSVSSLNGENVSFDEMTSNDAIVSSFLLPHIFRPEMIKEFIKEEIKIEQILQSPSIEEDDAIECLDD